MALHPDLDAFLQLAAAAPPLHGMSVADARRAYGSSTETLDAPGPDVPIESVLLERADGSPLSARLYRGSPERAAPTLLFFHGGGYVLGDLDSHDGLCRALAFHGGCSVVSVDYRRAPEHRFPAAFDDARSAWVAVTRRTGTLGIDPQRLAVGGDSVGGSLAAAVCISARDHGLPRPSFQWLLYPCLAAWQDTPSHVRLATGHLLEARTLQWMFTHYLRDDVDRRDWRFAPLEAADLRQLPPAHVDLAEYDPLVDEGRDFVRRLQAAGVATTLREHAGVVHDFARLGNVMGDGDDRRRRLGTGLRDAFASLPRP